jgi:translocation and assembly module TamB
VRALRLALWLGAASVLLLALLFGAGAWLLHSESFSIWAAEQAEARSGGTLRLAGVDGTLAGELRFARVEVDIDASRVVGEDVRLRVDLRSILARALVLDFLRVGRVSYTFVPGDVGSSTAPRSVPILVRIRDADIVSAQLVTPNGQWSAADTHFGLRLLNNHLELSDVRATLDTFAIQAAGSLTWTDVLALDLTACANGRYREEPVALCGSARGDFPDLATEFRVQAPFALSGAGNARLADDFAIDVDAQWSDAALDSLPGWRSPEGSVHLSGPLRALRVTGSGTAIIASETLAVAVDGQYGTEQIRIDDARIAISDMAATVSGTVAANGRRASLVVTGSAIDPAHWQADWPGSLDVNTRLDATIDDGLVMRFEDLTVTGQLRGRPVVATGALVYDDTRWSTDGLNVISRSDSIAVSGTVSDALNLRVTGEIGDLALLLPEVGGRLRADLDVRGALLAPTVDGEVELHDVSFGEWAVDDLAISGVAGLAIDEPFRLSAQAAGLRAGAVSVETAALATEGTLGTHSASFSASAADWRLAGELTGGWDGSQWRGAMNELVVDPRILESWSLSSPAAITMAPERAVVPRACLAHAASEVCMALNRAGTLEDFVSLSATQFDIGILQPLFPSGFAGAGAVDFDLRLENSSAGPRGEARVRGTAAAFSVDLGDGAALDFPLETVQLGASMEQAHLRLAASVGSAGIGQTVVNLDVEDVRRDDSPLRGNVSLSWVDTTALALLSPDVDNFSGPITADLTLGGTVGDPAFGGEVRWTDGSIEVPEWGLIVESIEGRAIASGSDRLQFTGTGLVDGASIEIDGSTLLDPSQNWPTQLRLRGEELLVVQLPDAEIFVSPELTADVMLPDINVRGEVVVPRASIEIVGLPAQAVVPSADTVVHGREEVEAPHPLHVRADLDVILGDDVRYSGGNVDAKVSGMLSLSYESERRAAAVGALTLTGQYDAYGNPMDLERGQLIFAGPWDNPALDVRAVRKIEEKTVGVQLVGTLKAPEATIFSEPAMSEADALSYLLFGRPLEAAGGGETATLQSVALSMGLMQALPVIERIGTSLGLDDFSIRGTDTDAGALMAGKYLSPNVYLRYSYGLFNRIGGLLLRYRINERLSLETQSGEQKSMDLLYTVEKD